MPSAAPKPGSVRHVVVFKYKKDVDPEQIAQVTRAFAELEGRIPGITAFEHGVNNSPEGKNLGFTHVYQLTFDSVASRDRYLPHPEHQKFGELLGQLGVLDDVAAVRAQREQTFLDLVGDGAHAVHGLDLAVGAAGIPF
jgi:hypothetical protein